MRATKPWVEALSVDPHKLNGWALEVPKHESITFWCLERGHLRSKEYFDWAMNHYGLAFVNDGYFKGEPNRDLWQKIQSVANWGPEMLPIDEWDGIIFVACVEPPEDIQWSFPVQYVLASAENLRAHWDRLSAEPTKVTMPTIDLKSINLAPPPPPSTAPVTSEAAPTPKPVAPSSPGAAPAPRVTSDAAQARPSQAPTPAAPAAAVPASTASHDEAVKVGFELNPPKIHLPDLEDTAERAPLTVGDASLDEPEGLSLKIQRASLGGTEASIPPGHEVFDQDDVPTGIVPNPLLNTTLPENPVTAKSEEHHRTSPQSSAPDEASDIEQDEKTAFTIVRREPAINGMIDSDALAPARLEAAKDDDARIAWVFQQLKQSFKHSWLMRVKDTQMLPWRWDKSVSPRTDAALQPIDLHEPSLFRVVFRTKMPYHGPVISNMINTSFFKNWSLKSTPPHVTATPIVVDGELVAILIAAGPTPENSDQTLVFAEKMTPAVISALSKKPAAA